MRTRLLDVRESIGRVLLSTILRGDKKLLSKGNCIRDDDVLMLQAEAIHDVWVFDLEPGEIGEDEAVMHVAKALGSGSVEIRPAAGGRGNLFAAEPACLLVDSELLNEANSGGALVIATARNLSYVRAGGRVSTIKSVPFAVPELQLHSLLALLAEKGPILQARPIRKPVVAVLYTDPANGTRAAQLFSNIMAQRLERLGSIVNHSVSAVEEEASVAGALEKLLSLKPAVVLIASTTAPAGPYDSVGRAMLRVGCQIERFLAPVEAGSLLLLGYKDDVPILSAPGCYRSAKPNVLDLVLPPFLARYRLSTWDIASLGHGGLLD